MRYGSPESEGVLPVDEEVSLEEDELAFEEDGASLISDEVSSAEDDEASEDGGSEDAEVVTSAEDRSETEAVSESTFELKPPLELTEGSEGEQPKEKRNRDERKKHKSFFIKRNTFLFYKLFAEVSHRRRGEGSFGITFKKGEPFCKVLKLGKRGHRVHLTAESRRVFNALCVPRRVLACL